MPINGVNQFLQTVTSTAGQVNRVLGAGQNVLNAFGGLGSALGISSLARLGNLPVGAEETYENYTPVSWSAGSESLGNDWRVRIHLPTNVSTFMNSPILQPLYESNNSMVFPTTPQILVTHSANYNNLQPTHTNYAFPIYESSSVEDITITAEFPVENEVDGRYWISAVHFMRSATKMFYGDSNPQGNPPVVCRLNGYGEHILNDMPVVITNFTTDLPVDVDYIQCTVQGKQNYVPTQSSITVTLQPQYARRSQSGFSLNNFVAGSFIGKGKEGFV